ncbi:hypothetical protein H0H81_005714 [Sphagnurus paluster]|uniref:Uncharacterized protein n=1 Tax=Sphagnurus paluster TaxID=117069 RepID=A0A9P7K3U0_9AGAR|nr:hypothetical protein H0H81_005714 [Sphagnurus paluster]
MDATMATEKQSNSSQSAPPVPAFDRFLLPGFTLPLGFTPSPAKENLEPVGEGRELFLNAITGITMPLTTLREFTMLRFMNEITEKPDWNHKVFDDEIATKWRIEALSAEGQDMTENMVDWCIAELRYKANQLKPTGAISVYNGDVVKSDTAISPLLRDALKAAVAPLENIPPENQDWHPGSDDKVLDLVHPSLFPLIFGRTRTLRDEIIGLHNCIERCGDGEVLVSPTSKRSGKVNRDAGVSVCYQWLPCDVDISGGPGQAKITSYINNLHPEKHKDLYSVIE